MKRHQQPPGPKGGYTKGGRPVKPRYARELGIEELPGVVVYGEGEFVDWVFTKGDGPLIKRLIGQAPRGLSEEEFVQWVKDTMANQTTRGFSAGEDSGNAVDVRRAKKFIKEMWGSTSKTKK